MPLILLTVIHATMAVGNRWQGFIFPFQCSLSKFVLFRLYILIQKYEYEHFWTYLFFSQIYNITAIFICLIPHSFTFPPDMHNSITLMFIFCLSSSQQHSILQHLQSMKWAIHFDITSTSSICHFWDVYDSTICTGSIQMLLQTARTREQLVQSS